MGTIKIRCVERFDPNTSWFEVGKVYEARDGNLFDEQSYHWHNCFTIDDINENVLSGVYRFELVTSEQSKPTEEQLVNLKPGDKVRLRSDRGPYWNTGGEMDKYCNQIVTIREVYLPDNAFYISDDMWVFELTDIVEIISSEPSGQVKLDPFEEPTPVKPAKPAKPWKESLIEQINQLPYEGGVISFTVCERERARIIELINTM